jgi:hypothetical protein
MHPAVDDTLTLPQDVMTPPKPAEIFLKGQTGQPSAVATSSNGPWLAVGTTTGDSVAFHDNSCTWSRVGTRGGELASPVTALAWGPRPPSEPASDASEVQGILLAEGRESGAVAWHGFRRVTSGPTPPVISSGIRW